MSDVNKRGFSLIEVLVSLAVLSIIILLLAGVIVQMKFLQNKTGAERETLDAANRALSIMTYDIKGAEGIYTPTTTADQLSLQTTRYITGNATFTYVDFFLCGLAICLKKELQDPIVLTPETVSVTGLQFTKIQNDQAHSIKISITANYKNTNVDSGDYSTVTVDSTVALRKY